jgi:hypothetical protein
MSSLIFARVVRSLPPEEARGKTDRVKSAECPTNVKEVVARFDLGHRRVLSYLYSSAYDRPQRRQSNWSSRWFSIRTTLHGSASAR